MTIAQDIAAILAAQGGDATITRTTTGTRDPVSRNTVGGSSTTIPAKAVQDTRKTWVANRREDGSQGSLIVETVLYSATQPFVGDIWTFGGKALRVTSVELIAPAGEALLYTATVDR